MRCCCGNVVICLERGAVFLHMVQLMSLHPKTSSFLASFKSRLVLPFWYRLTQLVLEERPLNGCSSSSSSTVVCFQDNSASGREISTDKSAVMICGREFWIFAVV